MIRTLFLIFFLFFHVLVNAQNILGLSFQNIEDSTVSLSGFAGKKILFIIAPMSEADSIALNQIKLFQDEFPDSIYLVGIISLEHGYADSNKIKIKQLYSSRNIDIVLTAPMFVKKGAGSSQSALMQWLTHRNFNKRFSDDVIGVFQKFFIDETGKLYSVLIPELSLLSAAVRNNVRRRPFQN